MNEQEILFKSLKNIKDFWIKASTEKLNKEPDAILSKYKDEYNLIKSLLITDEAKLAYSKILDEVLSGVIHSILVIFDGGDVLSEHFSIDIINADTNKSLTENVELHDEFFGYLLDVEENQ